MTDKKRSTIMLNEEVFKNTRIYAIKSGMDISSFTEEALIEKIERCREIEKSEQELSELKATINVSLKLFQQLKRKPDFDTNMAEEFVKTITAGIDPKYHYYVKKCLEQNKILPMQTPQPQTPYDNILTTVDDYHTVFRMNLPGISKLKFPIDRGNLTVFGRQNSEEGDFGLFNFAMNRIPGTRKIYKNMEELEKDLMIVFNNDMKDKGISKVITKCIIADTGFRKTQEQFLEEQRERNKFVTQTQKVK